MQAAAGLELSFAPAHEGDFETLLELRSAAMRESLERLGRFDAARARERFRTSFFAEQVRRIFVGDELVGFLSLRPLAGVAWLDHLYIHPSHQGRGIGSAALREIFRELDAAGVELRLGALRESASNRFYLRHGLREVERGEWDVYYMRKPGGSSRDP